MNTIILPVVVEAKQHLVWSEDTIIELHDDKAVFLVNYIFERPVDADDEILGMVDDKEEYRFVVKKDTIEAIQWAYDPKDKCYYIKVMGASGSIAYNTKNKKEAVEKCLVLEDWLFS